MKGNARLLAEHGAVVGIFSLLTWVVMFGRSNLIAEQSYGGGLEHDAGTYVWYLWHLKEALFGGGELLFSDRLFFPVGMNMVRQDWTPVTAALGLPFAGLGSIGAYNMEVALAFVLCGWFTYMLARHLGAKRAYALLAGLIFAYCEFRMLKASYHGHLTHVNQQFVPLYLLFTLRYFDLGKVRDAAGAGVAFFLATFCTPYQMVFLIVWSVFLVLHRFLADAFTWGWPPRPRPGGLRPALRKTLGFSLLAGGTAVLLVMPLIVAVGPRSLFLMPGALSRFQSIYSADLLSFVIPTLGKSMGWPYFSGEGGCAFQGYTVLALGAFALFAAIRWRAGSGYWLGFGLLFFLLSLGSTLVVGGKEVTWLPFYAVIEQIPILRHARVASRFSSLLTLCLGLAGAMALTRAEGKWLSAWPLKKLRWARAAVLLAVGVELLGYRAHATMGRDPTIRPFPVPAPYRQLAAEKEDSSLLTYPLIWEVASGHLGPLHYPRDYYFYQTVHRKRLITGFGDAVPNTALAYFRRLPLLAELVAIEAGQEVPPPTESQQAEARHMARALGIRTILVNMKKIVRDQVDAAPRAARALAYIREALPVEQIPAADSGAVWLRVRDEVFKAKDPGVITFKGAGSLAHLGSGFRRVQDDGAWYAEAPLGGRETEVLYIPMVNKPGQELVLDLRCGHHEVKLLATLNGKELARLPCKPVLTPVSFPLNPKVMRPGMNHLRFVIDGEQQSRSVPIGTTGVSTQARLRVRSQGLKAGNSASILLGDRDLAPDSRGYNVAVIHPDTGELIMAAGFDLVADDGEQASRMVQLIAGVPAGMIVCIAVKDDGAMNLTGDLVAALKTLGAKKDLRGKTRSSYALIGVKGAKAGTALERFDADRTATIDLASLLQVKRIEVRAVKQ